MPDVYGPFSNAPWAESQWYRDAPLWAPTGVQGPPSPTTNGGDLGVTLSGLTWSMALGRAHVRGAAYERTGTAATGASPVNSNGTLDRIDRLVLRRDLAAKTVLPVLLQGTPAATPVPPALQQVENGQWDAPLFRWTVPKNSGPNATGIVDERAWLMADIAIEGKMWRTGGASAGITTANVPVTIVFDAARTSGGFVFDNANDALTVPATGMYDVQARGYTLGGATPYQVSYRVIRNRGGSTREAILAPLTRKMDSLDESTYMFDRVALQAGDKLTMVGYWTAATGAYYGIDEGTGVYLSARYVGPLVGATPF